MNIPPQSVENEKAVIASIIEDSSIIDEISFLKSDDFYNRYHAEMFEIILSESSKGNPVDFPAMLDLVNEDIGGIGYLTDICKSNSSTSNAIAYARRVLADSVKRKAIGVYKEACDSIYEKGSDFVGVIAEASEKINSQLSRSVVGDALTIDDLIELSLNEMERSSSDLRTGISTGIEEIDDMLGYQNLAIGEITFFGAQSKNGKTLTANTITARCELLDDECAHVFSIEMPATGMFNGIVSAMSSVPSNFYARQSYYHDTQPSRFDEWMSRWGSAASELRDKGRVTIDGRKDVSMQYICSEMRKQASLAVNRGKKLKLVVIDHLHRIAFDTSKKQMTYAMGDDVRMLKNAASDLGIAVVLLGQLNENCKDRNPTAFDILDTARVRHEIQCFIGSRIFREQGGTYIGYYSDAHRYADHETKFHPSYMRMKSGVIRQLEDHEKHWSPSLDDENK